MFLINAVNDAITCAGCVCFHACPQRVCVMLSRSSLSALIVLPASSSFYDLHHPLSNVFLLDSLASFLHAGMLLPRIVKSSVPNSCYFSMNSGELARIRSHLTGLLFWFCGSVRFSFRHIASSIVDFDAFHPLLSVLPSNRHDRLRITPFSIPTATVNDVSAANQQGSRANPAPGPLW